MVSAPLRESFERIRRENQRRQARLLVQRLAYDWVWFVVLTGLFVHSAFWNPPVNVGAKVWYLVAALLSTCLVLLIPVLLYWKRLYIVARQRTTPLVIHYLETSDMLRDALESDRPLEQAGSLPVSILAALSGTKVRSRDSVERRLLWLVGELASRGGVALVRWQPSAQMWFTAILAALVAYVCLLTALDLPLALVLAGSAFLAVTFTLQRAAHMGSEAGVWDGLHEYLEG